MYPFVLKVVSCCWTDSPSLWRVTGRGSRWSLATTTGTSPITMFWLVPSGERPKRSEADSTRSTSLMVWTHTSLYKIYFVVQISLMVWIHTCCLYIADGKHILVLVYTYYIKVLSTSRWSMLKYYMVNKSLMVTVLSTIQLW